MRSTLTITRVDARAMFASQSNRKSRCSGPCTLPAASAAVACRSATSGRIAGAANRISPL
jgi:hypothetical protein